jgi:uncharacterized protein involved in type VI secretion and phage assembly
MTRGTKTRTYQDQSPADMLSKICNEHSLRVGTNHAGTAPHKYVLQASESDWDFVQRMAREQNCEFVVDGTTAHFRRVDASRTDAPELELGETLLSFQPRASAAMQPSKVVVRSWDVTKGQPLVGESSSAPAVSSSISFTSSKLGRMAKQMGSDGTVLIATKGSTTRDEAQDLAKAVHGRMAEAGVEASGMAMGEPRIKAGRMVDIKGVGNRFSGKYMVSASTHLYRSSGYRTKFVISGRNARTLSELLGGGGEGNAKPRFGGGLVVGVVTDINDPDKLGRIRVKFPQLVDGSGADVQGWWARVVSIHAGSARGMVFMPEIGDEVVVGFEQGDFRRAYVLGSVFHGGAKPGAELFKGDKEHEGSLLVETPKRFIMNTGDKIHMKSAKEFELVVGKDHDLKVAGAWITKVDKTITIETSPGQKIVIKAGGDLELNAGSSGKVKISGLKVEVSGQAGVDIKGATVNVN